MVAVGVTVVPTTVAVAVKSGVELTDTVATKFVATTVEFAKVKPATGVALFPQNNRPPVAQVVVTDTPST